MGDVVRSRVAKGLLLLALACSAALFLSYDVGAVGASLGPQSPWKENSAPKEPAVPQYAGQALHHHRLRYTTLGAHYDVSMRVYLSDASVTGKSIRFKKENNQCFTNFKSGPSIVTITVGNQSYFITENNLCNESSSQGMFNRNFPLTGMQADASLGGKRFVEVTVKYTDVSYLDNSVNGDDRNAIGFSASVVGDAGAKIAPWANSARNFSVQSNQQGGKASIRLPVALPCSATAYTRTAKITIYDADADNDMFGKLKVEVYEKGTNNAVSLNGTLGTSPLGTNASMLTVTAGNKSNATFTFTADSSKKYVIKISELFNGNTIDIGFSDNMQTIYGAVGCPGQTTPRSASIDAVAAITRSDIEPGESTSGVVYASVTDFPSLPGRDWPYQVAAVQDADATNTAPSRSAYSAQRVNPATSETPVITVVCRDGTPKTSCGAGYQCADGHLTNSPSTDCSNHGGRKWYCNWTNPGNGTVLEQKYFERAAQPSCAIWQYQCRSNSDSSQWVNSYKDWIDKEANGCDNRWVCPAPSAEPNIISGSQPTGNVCKLFRCAVPEDIGYNLEYGRMFHESNVGAASARCDFRCPANPAGAIVAGNYNGRGGWAPLSSGDKHASGDLNCYYQPSFSITCSVNGGVPFTEIVGGEGNYCVRNLTVTAAAGALIGSDVCISITISSPTNGMPWPGVGKANDETWTFSVSPYDDDCAPVIARPIVHFRGGDVSVGSPFATSICATNPANSSIVTWPGVSHGGSSVDWAAYASGNITNFATAKKQNVNVPRGLAFANTVGSGNVYGGSYGPMPCIANHAGMKTAGIGSIGSLNASLASGSYDYSGPNINNSPTIRKGRQLVIYVDHDLRIGSNIVYDRTSGGGWASVEDIPGLKVVVTGNISIDPAVSQLDGIYVAQPDGSGNGGNIYTCADTSGNPISNHDTCKQAVLTVNGSFIAKRVVLGRTAGTAITGQPAEVFNYLPEVWFTDWPDADAQKGFRYDSISNLPPIL